MSLTQKQNFVVIAMVLFCFWVISANIQINIISIGIDPCYKLVANLYSTGHIFGKDLLFTYGPLAFLGLPENIGFNVIYATWAYLFFKAGYFLSIVFLIFSLHKHKSLWQTLLFYLPIGIFLGLNNYANNYSVYLGYVIFFTIINCLLVYSLYPKNMFLYLAGILTSFVGLIKPAFCFLGLICLISYYFQLVIEKRKLVIPFKLFLALTLPYLILWYLFIGNFSTLINYLKASVEFTLGNSDAMISGYLYNWFALVLSILLPVIALIFGVNKKLKSTLLVIYLTGIIFWLKYVLVRVDHIFIEFLPLYFYFIFLIILFSDNLKKYCFTLILIIISISCVNWYSFDLSSSNQIRNPYFAFDWFKTNLKSNWRLGNIFYKNSIKMIDDQSFTYLKALKFDKVVLDTVRNSTIDAYPFDMTCLFANNLKWDPRPVFQSYLAYTPWLDHQNELFFYSSQAPQYLAWHSAIADPGKFLNSIDNRYLLNDEPLTLKTIFRNYCMVLNTPKVFLFKHFNPKITYPEIKLNLLNTFWNKWIDVPVTSGRDVIFAKIKVDNDFWGKIKRSLYRNSMVFIDYQFADGKIISHTLPITNAVNGVWLNPYILDFQACENKLVNNNIFKACSNIIYKIEYHDDCVISGWCGLKNIGFDNYNMFVVLQNEKTHIYYTFTTYNRFRPDVTAALHNNINYDYSGFESRITDLPLGKYKIGVNLVDKNNSFFSWTDSSIIINKIKFGDKSWLKSRQVKSIRLRNANAMWFEKNINIQFLKETNLLPKI